MEHETQQTNSLASFFSKLPLISLLIANAIPLIGVLFLGWDAFVIVLLYWAENVVIGFYNVLKMATVKLKHPLEVVARLFPIGFFTMHYGLFTGVHGVLILAMFKKESKSMTGGSDWPCFLWVVQMACNTLRQAWLMIPDGARWVIAAMFISHGVSFGYNYLYKRECAAATVDQLMGQPYGCIVVMHIAILGGGFLTMSLGSPIGLLLVLVLLKTAIDLALHNRQHKAMAAKAAA